MPVGPNGEQLPYPGEPGYEEAPPMYPAICAAEPPPEGVVPERDLKPMMDEADQILAALASGEALPGGPEGAPVEGEVIEEEIVEEAAPVDADIQALADMLEVEADAAQNLFDASQQMERTRGMTPKELGELLLEDFQLRMELERIAGGAEDDAAVMGMEMMGGPAGAPPMGPPMGGPPME